jgi:membrane-bound lytic murein transglycosylase B
VFKTHYFNTKTPFGNWSSYYAMAVIELAEAVAREVKNTP